MIYLIPIVFNAIIIVSACILLRKNIASIRQSKASIKESNSRIARLDEIAVQMDFWRSQMNDAYLRCVEAIERGDRPEARRAWTEWKAAANRYNMETKELGGGEIKMRENALD